MKTGTVVRLPVTGNGLAMGQGVFRDDYIATIS